MNSKNGYFTVNEEVNNPEFIFELNMDLSIQNLLGVDSNRIFIPWTGYRATMPFKFRPISNFVLTCSEIENKSSYNKSVRSIPIQSKFGQMESIEFSNIEYYKLVSKNYKYLNFNYPKY